VITANSGTAITFCKYSDVDGDGDGDDDNDGDGDGEERFSCWRVTVIISRNHSELRDHYFFLHKKVKCVHLRSGL
jgi:hypothetical protein